MSEPPPLAPTGKRKPFANNAQQEHQPPAKKQRPMPTLRPHQTATPQMQPAPGYANYPANAAAAAMYGYAPQPAYGYAHPHAHAGYMQPHPHALPHAYHAQYAAVAPQHTIAPPPQHVQPQQQQPHAQANMYPPHSTRQYYQKPNAAKDTKRAATAAAPPKKSPTPQIEMCRLCDNKNQLPPRVIVKLRAIEQKSNENTTSNSKKSQSPAVATMIPVGECSGNLFGNIKLQSYAQPGVVQITYTSQRGPNDGPRQHVLGVKNANGVYLGQCDTKLVAIFSELVRDECITLKAKIVDADLRELSKRLPANKYLRKLLISVSARHDAALSLVQKTRKKVKQWRWFTKQILLRYFEGEEVEFTRLYNHVVDSANSRESFDGTLEQLESDFIKTMEKYMTAEDLSGIDPYDEMVTTKLLKHQRIGLEWLILRENFAGVDDEDELPSFFKEIEDKETGDIKYVNLISDEEIEELPEMGCGGILADDMGLGKTLQCISLLATNSGYQNDPDGDGPTLIVAPLTVIGNWVSQIQEHCADAAFRVLVYHGPHRERDLDVIKSYHVVITTFDIVALEYSDENEENREEMRKHYGCGLQYIPWLRVVLDEAHKIRSRKTRVFKACNALQAKSRWCLSGTPVQNRLDDLYSLFCFLKLQPICEQAFWKKFIVEPLKNGNPIGFDRLRTVMRQLCLRRDKTMKIGDPPEPIIQIPPKVVNNRRITFLADEQKSYDALMQFHKEAFNRMRKNGDKEIMRNFSSVLSMLLRLRQACAHMALVPELNKASSSHIDIDELEDAQQECASCGMSPEGSTLTTCNHVYCKDCFLYELEINSGQFPCTLCGDKLTAKSIAQQREPSVDAADAEEEQKRKEDDEEEEEEENGENEDDEDGKKKKKKKKRKKYVKFVVPDGHVKPSTKMQALLNDINSWKGKEVGGVPHKAVVFSQWTSVLDLLARCLEQEDISYERLDGSMGRAAREDAMSKFRTDDSIQVFLMSLKAGNLGVNMTAANHVYMMDPWWNPATEDQAVDRVHRLGQKRMVTVNHFVIEGSVEEKIIEIQERKRKLIASAMGSKEKIKDARKREWLEDLKELFTSK